MPEVFGLDRKAVEKLAATVRRVNANGLDFTAQDKFRLAEPQRWFWGVIVCCGPRGCKKDPDFKDNRYWFKRAFVANSSGADPDDYDAQVETSKEKVNVAVEPTTLDGKANPYYLHRAATHHFEACGTHEVKPNTIVRVFWEYDRSQKAKPRYSIIVADRWADCLKPCDISSSSSSSSSKSSSSSGCNPDTDPVCWFTWTVLQNCDGTFDPPSVQPTCANANASPFGAEPIGQWINTGKNALGNACIWVYHVKTRKCCNTPGVCTDAGPYPGNPPPSPDCCPPSSSGSSGSGSGGCKCPPGTVKKKVLADAVLVFTGNGYKLEKTYTEACVPCNAQPSNATDQVPCCGSGSGSVGSHGSHGPMVMMKKPGQPTPKLTPAVVHYAAQYFVGEGWQKPFEIMPDGHRREPGKWVKVSDWTVGGMYRCEVPAGSKPPPLPANPDCCGATTTPPSPERKPPAETPKQAETRRRVMERQDKLKQDLAARQDCGCNK